MKWTERRRTFRAILAGEECIYPASVYDPVSARFGQELGFELGMVGGSIASFATLGSPDIVLLTLTELTDMVRRMSQASPLPLLIDADHGFGNAMNVARTVEELEVAGIAGLTIEDTLLPAPFGTKGKANLISVEEGVGKMRAAIEARTDRDLVVVGRTSALQMIDLPDTIARLRAYEDAGVDALFVAGVETREQLAALASELHLPLVLGASKPELVNDRDLLRRHRVRVCLQGHLPFMAAVKAVYDCMHALRNGTVPKDVPGIASPALMRQALATDNFDAKARTWLGL